MGDNAAQARRALSSSLFNNTYFADVVLRVAELAPTDDQFVTVRKIASTCALGDSVVRTVVLRLEAAHLLARLPRMGGPRGEQHFSRATSLAWDRLVELCRAMAAAGADTPVEL